MVKKKIGGGKRFKAAIKAKEAGESEPTWEGVAPAKHLQRKISKKVNFLDKVAASKKSVLAAKAVIAKKGRKTKSKALTDLSSLSGSVSELLLQQQAQTKKAKRAGVTVGKLLGRLKARKAATSPSTAASGATQPDIRPRAFGHGVGTLRARSAIMLQESERVQQVMSHPLYKVDPITAITNHLNATLPPAPAPARVAAASRRDGKGKKGTKGVKEGRVAVHHAPPQREGKGKRGTSKGGKKRRG